jgi:hypothetical protein
MPALSISSLLIHSQCYLLVGNLKKVCLLSIKVTAVRDFVSLWAVQPSLILAIGTAPLQLSP